MEKETKLDILSRLLAKELVTVTFNPLQAGVIVPSKFKDRPILVLNLSWAFRDSDMALKPADLDECYDRVEGTLTFQGEPFRCTIPMYAVFAFHTKSVGPMTFPDQVPAELRHQLLASSEPVKTVDDKPLDVVGVKRGPFTVLKGGKA